MSDKSNSELVRELIDAFTQLKDKIEAENSDIGKANLENSVKQLIQGQKEMQKNISEMKREILNPYNGVIVETIKNTEFRKKMEEKGDLGIDLLTEHKELMKWKGVVTKVSWLILTTVAGIIAFLITNK